MQAGKAQSAMEGTCQIAGKPRKQRGFAANKTGIRLAGFSQNKSKIKNYESTGL
jgi:hypothetical protein